MHVAPLYFTCRYILYHQKGVTTNTALSVKTVVLDPGEGVCADPVNRDAILEGGGPGPPGGNKERQLSPDKGRGKT
jgi:hypothetical protein